MRVEAQLASYPLTITHFLDRARTLFPRNQIVWRRPDRSLGQRSYAEMQARAARLANALRRLGVGDGDRVATLCWNHASHLEAYLAVPAMGAVLHTLNLRLHPSELGYIARHAHDSVVIVDRSLLPLFDRFAAEVPSLRQVLVVPDDGPVDTSGGRLDLEALIAGERDSYDWPILDENTPAIICYTSGTTDNPKGVVFTHRSTVLHTLVSCMRDTFDIGEADVLLPVVPMFHVNAWGLPFSAVATGAKLVFPGPHLDPKSLLELMARERVTVAAGVPTIWLGILALLDENARAYDLSTVRMMIVGGSAAPAAMIEGFKQRHNLDVLHAWGMTELNPMGTMARVKAALAERSDADKLSWRASQGHAVPFLELRHVGEDGTPLERDGHTMGELEVRGPWVARGYLGGESPEKFRDGGWFRTGDVVTVDDEGYIRIVDRSKDVIKSGGEWISSVALENALMAHPAVLEAAVFAGEHPKWSERPLAAVVLKPGKQATREELHAHLEPRFAKFWLPEAYVFVEQIPRTSTGKFQKRALREQYGNILLKEPKTSE